jgi:hypothetical protein
MLTCRQRDKVVFKCLYMFIGAQRLFIHVYRCTIGQRFFRFQVQTLIPWDARNPSFRLHSNTPRKHTNHSGNCSKESQTTGKAQALQDFLLQCGVHPILQVNNSYYNKSINNNNNNNNNNNFGRHCMGYKLYTCFDTYMINY